MGDGMTAGRPAVVEKIARAMYEVSPFRANGPTWDERPAENRKPWLRDAEAAYDAMREHEAAGDVRPAGESPNNPPGNEADPETVPAVHEYAPTADTAFGVCRCGAPYHDPVHGTAGRPAVVEAMAEALLEHYGVLLYRNDAETMARIAYDAAAPLIAAAERERITAERDAWRELAEVRSELLACYRIGKYPSEQLLRRLDAASAAIRDYTPEPADSGTGSSGGDRDGTPIVVLCGSTRFGEAFQQANLQETLAGRIVLNIGCDTRSDNELWADPVERERIKAELDELHLRKIDLADEVLVLNVGGYIGDSTRREIEYATSLGKPIRYLEPASGPGHH